MLLFRQMIGKSDLVQRTRKNLQPSHDPSDTVLRANRDRRIRCKLWTVLAALATLSLTNCGYNAIQTTDEQVKSSWSEVVESQYQRRADLVPNLVNSVKGLRSRKRTCCSGHQRPRQGRQHPVTPEVLSDPAAFRNSRRPRVN